MRQSRRPVAGQHSSNLSQDNPFSPSKPQSTAQRAYTPPPRQSREEVFSPDNFKPLRPLDSPVPSVTDEDVYAQRGLTGNEIQDTELQKIVDQMRQTIKLRGATTIHGLGRHFRIVDDSGDGKINRREFEKTMREYGFDLTAKELDTLREGYDRDGDGCLSYDEFLLMVRGAMNARREGLVNMAYDVIDVNSDGKVTLEDVTAVYDCSKHPDVISGDATPQDVLREFLSQWDTVKADGLVTRNEFIEYYQNVSASIDEDDYFELMIRNAWHMAGGEGWCENTSNLRVLVEFKDGTSKVIGLNNDLGLDKTDVDAIKRRLQKQGVNVDMIKKISTSGAVARKKPPVFGSDRDRYFPSRGIIPTGVHANLPVDAQRTDVDDRDTSAIAEVQMYGYSMPGYTGHVPRRKFNPSPQYGV